MCSKAEIHGVYTSVNLDSKMKRVKKSGAFFKKKKKAKETKKHEGAMLKFLNFSGSNVSLTIPENGSNENPNNNVELQKYTEEISLSAKTQETGSIQSNANEINYAVPVSYGDEGENNDEAVAVVNNLPNDVASWPEFIDHQLRVELVKAGPEKYQNKEAPFAFNNRTIRDVAAAPQTPQLGGPRPTLGAQVSLKLLFGYVTIFSSADLFTIDLNCRKKLACDIISECNVILSRRI